MKKIYNKVKELVKDFLYKLSLAYHIIKTGKSLVLTPSVFHTSVKNIDILGDNNPYVCFENSEGGYDISYLIPWDLGSKFFTITVARFKGDNAGEIADAALSILNEHTIANAMVTGDKQNQPKPTNYIPYTTNVTFE